MNRKFETSMNDRSARFVFKWVIIMALLRINLGLGSEPAIDFRRQIQPILSEHCTVCHGADESARQAGLRLDVESLAYHGGESGTPAIVPGDSSASPIIQRIASSDRRRRDATLWTQKTLSTKPVASAYADGSMRGQNLNRIGPLLHLSKSPCR